jgi:hypothetical protein
MWSTRPSGTTLALMFSRAEWATGIGGAAAGGAPAALGAGTHTIAATAAAAIAAIQGPRLEVVFMNPKSPVGARLERM